MTSARLLYRPIEASDVAELVRLFRNPSVRRYLLDDELVSEEWVREEVAASAERFATTGAGIWALRLRGARARSTDEPGAAGAEEHSRDERDGAEGTAGPSGAESRIIGFVGFRGFFDPPRLQLLYGLHPTCRGRGLATEAARRICDHAFADLGFRLVEAATDAPNADSSRVLHRLGMRRVRADGCETSGTLFYVVDRDSWAAARTESGDIG